MTGVVAAAFVPMTPLVFRHLAGRADPAAELRDASVAAVREACDGAEQVVVLCPVGGREAPGDWHDPSRARPVHGAPEALSTQVGRHLLELAAIGLPASFVECTDGVAAAAPAGPRTALVVLGDGAAARSQGAPGHIDERSFPFDDALAAALQAGDGAALTAYDEEVAAALMVTGRHSWPAAAKLLPHASRAVLRHRSDPFGLTYVVALWRA
ncbi:hypothetical protein [Nocardioides jiangxiensis]|uniref:Catalytic LigB subunit of aromatic ring-opening dioxygenase n=1 Tax=Nocardioides jiangxiensis TaxID=3064524 RepID=A0ABT9B1U4_9ACTN|nr:hypothetical protein [Nocardioides sp. WY-20]MDO7868658.1 hypothetical protein [Nocardioides sp. WY-20]